MTRVTSAGQEDLDLASKPRSLYGSKFENGRVLVVGGSARFHGAPVIASNAAYLTLAALRAGAGYVITCVPESIVLAVRKLSPNIIVVPLSGANINQKDLPTLQEEAKKADAIVIGPGLGREKESLTTAAKLIAYCVRLGKKLVVDADALRSLEAKGVKLNKSVVLTPSEKEFEYLFGKKPERKESGARIKVAAMAARRLGAIVLLKGHIAVVSDGTKAKTITARTAALATMGTGDVLDGIIAGLMARGNDAFSAATVGAYVHAKIGDMLYRKMGYHIIAKDVVDHIPAVMKDFDRTIG